MFATRPRISAFAAAVGLLFLTSCGSEPEAAVRPRGAPNPEAAFTSAENTALPVILAYGDSLTAGHMVDRDMSYPAQLQEELDRLGYGYRVVNQGISGDTTSGGVARLAGALALDPEIVILELGANDGLRGIPIEVARENLSTMIEAFKGAGARVVLAGLTLPRNYGPDYIHDFEQMFVELAEEHEVDRIPFFLEGVAGDRALNLPDGIHPTAEGYTIVARNVLEAIEPLLK